MKFNEEKEVYEVHEWNRETLEVGKRTGLFESAQALINYMTHFGHRHGVLEMEHGGEVTPDRIYSGCVIKFIPNPSELGELMGFSNTEEIYIIHKVTMYC